MGFGLPSHIDQGVLFGSLGLWHLSNTLVSFARSPKSFKRRTWFPAPSFLPRQLRLLELWILLFIVLAFLATQTSHITDDLRSGTINSKHLQRFQHITFGMFFLVYTIAGIASESFDRRLLPLPDGALHSIFALAFLMELLVFHFGHHTGDTLESFAHMLMQVVLVAIVSAMAIEVALPNSPLVSTIRCMLVVLKGSWFFHIGLLINFPQFAAPLGCAIDQGSDFPVCRTAPDLMRAKSIQVLVFGWQALAILVATILGYGVSVALFAEGAAKEQYQRIGSASARPVPLTIIGETEENATPVLRSLSRRRSYRGMATP